MTYPDPIGLIHLASRLTPMAADCGTVVDLSRRVPMLVKSIQRGEPDECVAGHNAEPRGCDMLLVDWATPPEMLDRWLPHVARWIVGACEPPELPGWTIMLSGRACFVAGRGDVALPEAVTPMPVLRERPPAEPEKPKQKGPGDYLHDAILAWVGEGPTRQCGCKDRINTMNNHGSAWCREHLDEIVEWLVEEAEKRGWWKLVVAVPGSRFFIRRMVLGAIEKAEAGTAVDTTPLSPTNTDSLSRQLSRT